MSIIDLKDALNPHKNHKLRQGKSGGILARLAENAEKNQGLLKIIQHLLPDELKGSVTHASLSKSKLLVCTSTSAWATRLTFIAPQLLSSIKQLRDFENLTTVSIVVNSD